MASSVTTLATHSQADTSGRTAFLTLLVLGVIAYANSLTTPFLMDDLFWIRDNPQMAKLWPLVDWRRPFGFWTFQLQQVMHGLSLFKIHLVNLAIHIGCAWLIWAIATELLRLSKEKSWLTTHARGIALSIAAIWVVHPLTTAAVTYTVQRLESLMVLCYLFSIYALLKANRSSNATGWYAALLVAFVLGVGTKEVIVTCPIVLLLIDWAYLTQSWKQTWQKRRWVYLAMLLPMMWLAWTLRGTTEKNDYYQAGFGYAGCTPWEYLRSQASILLYYLKLAVWPSQLIFDHAWRVENNPWKYYSAGLAIVAILLCSIVACIRAPKIGVLMLAFFLILAPTSSFMPINDLAAEHRMYLPLAIVLGLVIVGIARQIYQHDAAPPVVPALVVVLVALLTARTIVRNHDYANPKEMWRKVAMAAPHNGRAHTNLAILLSAEAKILEERGELEKAAACQNEAVAELEASMQLDPLYYRAFLYRADAFVKERKFAEALPLYAHSIELHPHYLRAWHHQAMALVGLARYDEAIASLKQVEKLQTEQNRQSYLDVEKLLLQIEQLRSNANAKASTSEVNHQSS